MIGLFDGFSNVCGAPTGEARAASGTVPDVVRKSIASAIAILMASGSPSLMAVLKADA